MSRKDDIKRLLVNHSRRLQILKEQQALHGISADPKIPIEIKDIEAEIEKLQAELGTLRDGGFDEEASIDLSGLVQNSTHSELGRIQGKDQKTQVLRQLRTTLANLYPYEADARRIAQDAGLEITSLRLGDSAINDWHSILSEAEKRDKIQALVESAQEEYPANQSLSEAYQAYMAVTKIDNSAIQFPPTESSNISSQHSTPIRLIKILFLAANPRDTKPLQLDEEIRSIDQALRKTEFRDHFEILQHWAVRYSDLQELLLRHKPNIVHFSGHGSNVSEIILQDNQGNSHPLSVQALSRLFSILKGNIRCVVLNACYSEEQAQSIAQSIDLVVGMNKAIGDLAAINFATAFYQALGYGQSLQTAFELGCSMIDLANLNEQDTPQLLAKNKDTAQIVLIAI